MIKAIFREEDHKYFLDEAMTKEIPSVSSLLEHFGYSNFDNLRRMGKGDLIERAANYGGVVHQTLRLYDEGRLDNFDDTIFAEVQAWRQFIADYKPDFLIVEEPLISKVWGFGGTPDRYWLDNLVDIKTGQSTAAHALQTAFYKILIEENFPTFKVKNRFTVQIKDGYKVIPHKDRNDEAIVKSMLTIYNDKNKKGLLNGNHDRD